MKRRFMVVMISLFCALGSNAQVKAVDQRKAASVAKEDDWSAFLHTRLHPWSGVGQQDDYRWSGVIHRSARESSLFTVRKGNIERIVVYDSLTKWTRGAKAADASALREGARVSCEGKYDDQRRLIATRVEVQP